MDILIDMHLRRGENNSTAINNLFPFSEYTHIYRYLIFTNRGRLNGRFPTCR